MGRPDALLVLVGLGLTTLLSAQTPSERIVSEALAEVGIREVGCNNCGPQVEAMLRRVHMPRGANWCGAFQYTVMDRAGIPLPGDPARYAWVPSWFPRAHTVWRHGTSSMEDVRVGQQVGLYYPSLGRVAHIGVIVAIEGRFVITVEGNTNWLGSRDGGGVQQHRRRIDTIWVISQWYE
jgi:hypothetical protein